MLEGGASIWHRLTSFMFQYCQWPIKATQKSKLRAKNQEYFMNYDIMNDVLGYTLSVYVVHSSHIYLPLVSSLSGPVRFCLAYFHHVFDYGKNRLHIRGLPWSFLLPSLTSVDPTNCSSRGMFRLGFLSKFSLRIFWKLTNEHLYFFFFFKKALKNYV